MSQVKLTLRPPPNVDFVHGYPGIPPGAADRPQAAVKGAIEVRVPPAGVKAKWVRIELRKVETLPGGGPSNTFWDFVGPSPVNLWTAGEDFAMLMTQDFPFSIRIPESIPPSIALDNRAGIKYELVASVCTKGKKGFFRTRKSIVVSSMAPITIDKHELHSTWPVYSQPDSRRLTSPSPDLAGVSLTTDRNQTCYGPGDRITLTATLRNDGMGTVILRGFEISLKESTTFTGHHTAGGGPSGIGKKPQAGQPRESRTAIITDSKTPINTSLPPSTTHSAPLSCDLSPKHTTTSLSAARHIDVNYLLVVKALLGGGAAAGESMVMELPVVISNWQRNISNEAVRRIGPAPSLSLTPVQPHLPMQSPPLSPPPLNSKISSGTLDISPAAFNTTSGAGASTYSGRPTPRVDLDDTISSAYAGTTNAYGTTSNTRVADEFGYSQHREKELAGNTVGVGARPTHKTTNSTSSSAGGAGGSNKRYTVTNIIDSDPIAAIQAADRDRRPSGGSGTARKTSATAANGATTNGKSKNWPTAEEEKQRLFEQARAKVEKVQGMAALSAGVAVSSPAKSYGSSSTPPRADTGSSASRRVDATPTRNDTASPLQSGRKPSAGASGTKAWPTAEEEKQMLFNKAQAAVSKVQQGSSIARTASPDSIGQGSGSKSALSNAAAMYSSGIAARSKPTTSRTASPPPISAPISATGTRKPITAYPTAEQEKAALRLYDQAREAVNRTQGALDGTGEAPSGGSGGAGGSGGSGSNGIPGYDSLYGAQSPQQQQYQPPPFQAPMDAPTQLSEKERMRRAYAAQDAMAAQQQAKPAYPAYEAAPNGMNGTPDYSAPPPSFGAAPPSFNGGLGMGPATGAAILSEKEILRRKFAAEDAQQQQQQQNVPAYGAPQPPPPRTNSFGSSTYSGARSPPLPPPNGAGGSTRILSAIEEKALMRAKYEEDDRRANSGGSGSHNDMNGAAPPAPPPLMPRPPVDYIRETREEDARVSRYADGHHSGSSSGNHAFGGAYSSPEYETRAPGPPPPLPPKIND